MSNLGVDAATAFLDFMKQEKHDPDDLVIMRWVIKHCTENPHKTTVEAFEILVNEPAHKGAEKEPVCIAIKAAFENHGRGPKTPSTSIPTFDPGRVQALYDLYLSTPLEALAATSQVRPIPALA